MSSAAQLWCGQRRPRSMSTRRPSEFPTVHDLEMNTNWRPSLRRVRSPSDVPMFPSAHASLRQRRLSHRRSTVTDPFVSLFGDGNDAFDHVHAAGAANDIARFRAQTNQKPTEELIVEARLEQLPAVRRPGPPLLKRQPSFGEFEAAQRRAAAERFKRHAVEVTGDPTGVANGTYYFTEQPNKEPFFTRTEPHKATMAQRQSHGMWFLIAWGKDKNGKDAWGDYCAPYDGELPPCDGWRKCWRTKDKLRWEFGDEVPIRVGVHREEFPQVNTVLSKRSSIAGTKISMPPSPVTEAFKNSALVNTTFKRLSVEAAKLTLKEPVPSALEIYQKSTVEIAAAE